MGSSETSNEHETSNETLGSPDSMSKPLACDECSGLAPRTLAVRAGVETETQHNSVIPPLYLTSNFFFSTFGKAPRFDYTRSGNPTRQALADTLAALEGAEAAVITSSGMSAVMLALAPFGPQDKILAPYDCYGGTYRLLSGLAKKGSIILEFVDFTNLPSIEKSLNDDVKLVILETPSNPLLRITDIRKTVDFVKARQPQAIIAVDNTFMSPILQQPIKLGADLVIHSTTKYINGHSDVVGGALCIAESSLGEQYSWWANCLGITGAPFDSYLTLRGIRTLHARMKMHEENAKVVAEMLCSHPAVERVYYPGIDSHPGHSIAKAQQAGFGAIVSFELRGLKDASPDEAAERAVRHFLDSVELFSLAESLGGVESLIAHPASMTHLSMGKDAQIKAGISAGLLRLSIGTEAVEDLVADLSRALNSCCSG